MRTFTTDEKSLLVGAVMSAGVSGIGIYQLLVALSAPTVEGYIGTMIVGAMLFNAGVSGLTAIGAMWANYQAII
jgi:high-affinity Fe2+/Pb2+ permease